jgi:hypothetical protein
VSPRHPVAIAAALAAAAIAVAVYIHSASPAAPGRAFSWVPAQTSAQPTAPLQVAVPGASPSPRASSGIWGGLTLPLQSLFGRLNQDTQSTAAGQYTILQALENGLRDRIDDFLHWVTSRR